MRFKLVNRSVLIFLLTFTVNITPLMTAAATPEGDVTPALAPGNSHMLALNSAGEVWAWGGNQAGQLGDGTTVNHKVPVKVKGLPKAAAIAAGDSHSVALASDGTVWTWGSNIWGQLGQGTGVAAKGTTMPVKVKGLMNIIAVAAGTNQTYALKNDGTVWSWGLNANGRLGDGTMNNRNAPVKAGIKDAVSISAGPETAFAITMDGKAWAWGRNNHGQLGEGTKMDRSWPTPVKDLTDVVDVKGGLTHTIAVKKNGYIYGWGSNLYGQLGYSQVNLGSAVKPQPFPQSYPIRAIAAGDHHSLFLDAQGFIMGWGKQDSGQLGIGPGATTSTYKLVKAKMTDAAALSAKGTVTAVIQKNGTVWTWGKSGAGSSNAPAQVSNISLGTGKVNLKLLGLSVTLVGKTYQVNNVAYSPAFTETEGYYNAAVLHTESKISIKPRTVNPFETVTVNGTVVLAGSIDGVSVPLKPGENEVDIRVVGKDGLSTKKYTLNVRRLANITSGLAAGGSRLSLLTVGGELRTWGTMYDGKPSPVFEVPNIHQASVKYDHALAVDNGGFLWGFGKNDGFALARSGPEELTKFQKLSSIKGAKFAAAGDRFSLVVKSDGTVWGVGNNAKGQLGNNSTQGGSIPVMAKNLKEVTAVAAGVNHSLALTYYGKVYGFGDNAFGQTGDEKTMGRNSLLPVEVRQLDQVHAIAAGANHSVALRKDGTVWTWGSNEYGQLGDGKTANRFSPKRVSGLSEIVAIAAGIDHTLAIKADGTVWAWGKNDKGQLGNGKSGGFESIPVQVSGVMQATAIGAGRDFSIARLKDGSIWVWGNNEVNQLGGASANAIESIPVKLEIDRKRVRS